MFTITQYQVTLSILKPIIFNTYPGFYLRNALINAMVDYCQNPNRIKNNKVTHCQGCRFLDKCAYASLNLPVLEPVGTPAIMPFMLDVTDLIVGKYQQGEIIFGFRLLGNADKYASLFADSFDAIGKQYGIGENGQPGSFSLREMRKINVIHAGEILAAQPSQAESLGLSFRQLKLSDKMMDTLQAIPFSLLIQFSNSRISEIGSTYGAGPADNPALIIPPGLDNMVAHTAQMAKCNYQYAGSRQGYWFFNGMLQYSGNLSAYYNLLRLASYTGIGGFTSYGFGTFSLHNE